MKQKLRKILASSLVLMSGVVAPATAQNLDSLNTVNEAKEIIDRFTGGAVPLRLELSLSKTDAGCDVYSTSMTNGTLAVKGSSGVALCRGAYSFIKDNNAGMRTWQGQRFDALSLPTSQAEKTVTSPFRDHYYMNVVTYGYTMPYWDEERWDKEIDWMALHGVDMPLSLVGQEAVYRIVFKKMGFTDSQIDAWEVGPAHLPWMRMGNLSGNTFDGPLTSDWNERQIAMQKHILKRMRKLGMKPIFPAFGGFVPPAFKAKYPNDVTLTGWGWVPDANRNYRLDPSNALFVKIGREFVLTWDSIFGKGELYLSDSFNEMAIPSDQNLLSQYGDSIYESIHSANPDAKWVMQGWTVGYQRGDWKEGKFNALVKNVPNDKFMLLDMASDYNKYIWWNSYDWDFYNGFSGKEWVWSVIPNMGGKTAMTGRLDYYANGKLDALKSSNRANLTGYGFAPEGVENNEMIYELLCDGGWTDKEINLSNWMTSYAKNRYGEKPNYIDTYYAGLLKSVYNSFTDHPRFGWQTPGVWNYGSVNQNNDYKKAVETMFSQITSMPKEQLLKNDIYEAAALYCGGKVEDVLSKIKSFKEAGKTDEAVQFLAVAEKMLLDMDRALTCHTMYNLKNWEDQAQVWGVNSTQKNKYARNARRIVSIWYGNHTYNEPVADYAARLWAGLIRDYYLPRVKKFVRNQLGLSNDDIIAFENVFVKSAPSLSAYEAVPTDTLAFLKDMVAYAKESCTSNIVRATEIKVSNDSVNTWYAIHGGYEVVNDYVITQHGEGARLTGDSYVASGAQMWRFIETSTKGVYLIENRYGFNCSGTGQQSNGPIATMSNTVSTVKMKVRLYGSDTNRWAIIPASQNVQGFHLPSPGAITTWTTVNAEGSSWIFEEVPEALVPEAVTDDYDRYVDKLQALKTSPMGAVGQVKSLEVLQNAIDTVKAWATDINHQSYNAFLGKWYKLYKSIFRTKDDVASGVVSLKNNTAVRVKNRTVFVNGTSRGVKVYDMSGRRVDNKHLLQGQYVIACGSIKGMIIVN